MEISSLIELCIEQGKKNQKGLGMIKKICKIDGCSRHVDTKGLCHWHYGEYNRKRYRDKHWVKGVVCEKKGCNRPVYFCKRCVLHFGRGWDRQ